MFQPVSFFQSIVTKIISLISLIVVVLTGILMANYFLARQTETMVMNLVEKDVPQLISNEELSRKLSRLSDDIHIMLINSTIHNYALKPEVNRLLPVLNDIVSSSISEIELKQELNVLSMAVTDIFNHCIIIDDLKLSIQSVEKDFMAGIDKLEVSVINLIIDRKLQAREYELSSLEQISVMIPDLRSLLFQIKILVSESERTYITGKNTNRVNQKQIISMLADIESGLTTSTTAGDELFPIGKNLIMQVHDYETKIYILYQQMEELEAKISLLGNQQATVKNIMAESGKKITQKTGTARRLVIENLRKVGGIMLVLSLLIVVFLIVTGIVGAKIVRPIKKLTAAAGEIAAGNLGKEIKIGGNDEVGILSRSFAGMRNAVKDKIDDLAEKNKELSREILERKRIEDALRKSENKYRMLLENLPQKIFHKDIRSVYISANESFCRDLKIHPDEIIGKTDYDFFSKQMAEKYIADDKRILASGKTEEMEETYILEGQEFTVNTVKTPIKNEEGKVTGILGIFWDITHTKQLELHLVQAQKMEAIGTLAGGIAHDFNNILAAIIGHTELALLEASDQDDLTASLGQVLKAAGRAKDLVTRILAFSRQTEQTKHPIRLGPVIEEVLKMIRPSIPSTIEIHKEIGEESGCVMAEPTQIHQVLMNFCTNSAYAMREKGGILFVGLKDLELADEIVAQYPTLKSKSCVRLTVRDNGHGMEADALDRIFDPYFTTKDKGVGTGLGLAVVHGIVKSYDGAIGVISTPGEGTIFHIYFPRIKPEHEEKQVVSESMHLPRGEGCVLFVDDEEDLLNVGRQMLVHQGYDVVVNKNPLEALKVFRTSPEKFDLVITDQTMPKMTGQELTQELMKIRPDVLVIICTGYSELIDANKAKEIGIQAFVLKPFTMKTFTETVGKVLGKG